ncbi:hypothetical protein AB0C59_09500 [Streptomyces sp. NPDC048664]|uniref:hypothetical protein n=1 Tax=Streptomyces sp. NPDC048664 TaxID=3154505 RepID=UPI003429768E
MPRGRHRHSPPLHRLLPPSVIAGVSVVCAAGPWLFTEPTGLRVLAAAAAVTTAVGAFVMRSWDVAAGKQVADLTRARVSDEWQYEERVAELEGDLEESRELRTKLEHKLRAKRTELAKLRNEHAALLRRYATAETERASALEGRRLLSVETVPAARALPAAEADRAGAHTAPEAVEAASEKSERFEKSGADEQDTDGGPGGPRAFSPEGAALYLRAGSALARMLQAAEDEEAALDEEAESFSDTPPGSDDPGDGGGGRPRTAETADESETAEAPEATEAGGAPEAPEPTATAEPERSQQSPAKPARPSGHFAVPTAVAVVPEEPPRRRTSVQGGFDFFGAQRTSEAMESVQNEDLADVVGQEALAMHKAESESGFKPALPKEHGAGQVIDLTAHDETEQIDVQNLRTAAS